MSKRKQNTILAYESGYKVLEDGRVISPKGRCLKLSKIGGNYPYYFFSFRYNGDRLIAPVHLLCAYQKFGEKALMCECIRHLDGNSLNNAYDNIAIGTSSDNAKDIPEEVRKRSATIASHSFIMKWNEEDVIKIKEYYNRCHSYKETMNKFGILSKSSLHFILHHR